MVSNRRLFIKFILKRYMYVLTLRRLMYSQSFHLSNRNYSILREQRFNYNEQLMYIVMVGLSSTPLNLRASLLFTDLFKVSEISEHHYFPVRCVFIPT